MPQSSSAERGPLTVLVVEDDDDSRDSLADMLRDEGFAVEAARDGIEALDYLNVATMPVAMVLDLQMPRMSGGEVLSYVRGLPELADLPVCVLAGNVDDVSMADLVLEKPLLVSRLVEVQRWLHQCAETAGAK
jgi:CheY-like chemotaxis protein